MSQIKGVHHLAISTGDIKAQIRFFSEVLGMRLLALYWMHGLEGAMHGFLELNERSSIAFVAMPENAKGKVELGSSHAATSGGASAPGTMQHVSFAVPTLNELLALRNRIRSHGVPVFGPVDHGMCRSIYFAGPEGLNLEIATAEAAIDADAWVDPEVVGLVGISDDELASFLKPAPTPSADPPLPQPAYDPAKPHLHYPKALYEKMLSLPDDVISAKSSYPDPPVDVAKKRAATSDS